MKSTGIVRRIDDLGRIVIPREIRHRMAITKGDALEIFYENDMLCIKKYSGGVSDDVSDIIIKLKNEIIINGGKNDFEQEIEMLTTVKKQLREKGE